MEAVASHGINSVMKEISLTYSVNFSEEDKEEAEWVVSSHNCLVEVRVNQIIEEMI